MSTPFETWPASYGPRDVAAPSPDDAVSPPVDTATGEVVDEEPLRDRFLTWVTEQLGRVEAHGVRAADSPAWCPRWWEHPEVVERLYVAYTAYVHSAKLREEGDDMAMSSWWIQHWDHHARVIFDRTTGPFRACTRESHLTENNGRSLEIVPDPPPEDWTL